MGRRPIAFWVETANSSPQKGPGTAIQPLASDPRPHTFAARSLARSCSLIVSFLAIPRFVPTLRAHTACLAAHCTHAACMACRIPSRFACTCAARAMLEKALTNSAVCRRSSAVLDSSGTASAALKILPSPLRGSSRRAYIAVNRRKPLRCTRLTRVSATLPSDPRLLLCNCTRKGGA